MSSNANTAGYAGSHPLQIPGWEHVYSGKVRDLYQSADGSEDKVLVVASDRISAYDHVLSTAIPDKGAILTQLSLWWFSQLNVPHHVLASTVADGVPQEVAGRAMICQNLDMVDVECIARGYLTGSVLADYQSKGTVNGLAAPAGLVDGSQLPEPLFTPSAKADIGEHDENITLAQLEDRVGHDLAEALAESTLRIYSTAATIAAERGIILADTKVEFGFSADGVLTLGDEVLTPDSSRFWDASAWEPGHAQASFDKQYVRDWLTGPDSGWDKNSGEQPPQLPEDVVERTRARYVQAFEQLTGESFGG